MIILEEIAYVNNILFSLCKNAGFSNIFLYEHLDDILLKILKIIEDERE